MAMWLLLLAVRSNWTVSFLNINKEYFIESSYKIPFDPSQFDRRLTKKREKKGSIKVSCVLILEGWAKWSPFRADKEYRACSSCCWNSNTLRWNCWKKPVPPFVYVCSEREKNRKWMRKRNQSLIRYKRKVSPQKKKELEHTKEIKVSGGYI